jgi:heme exporter protein A
MTPFDSSPPLLAAAGVARRFGARRVLDGVDLALAAGQLQLILGPNGAGKTTLLRVLAGLTRPTAGQVRLLGRPLRGDPALRRALGVLAHQSLLYDDLTPAENLAFTGRLYRLPHPSRSAAEALRGVGLDPDDRAPVGRLSRGTVQRVAFARATLHGPRVLLLDEPFTGLDADATGLVVERLRQVLAEGGAAVVVSHSLAEAWPLATRVSLLRRGRWALDEPRPADREAWLGRWQGALHG